MVDKARIEPACDMRLRKLSEEHPDEPWFVDAIFMVFWEHHPVGTVYRVELITDTSDYGCPVVYLTHRRESRDYDEVVIVPPHWLTTDHFEVVEQAA